MIINAREAGIVPGAEIGAKINELFEKLSKTDGEKELVLEKGVYYIDAENCPEKTLYITNTVGEREFSRNENPPARLQRIALYLHGIKNLKISGEGAAFVIRGRATNAVLEKCENVELSGIEIKVEKPDCHELKAVSKTPFYIDYEIDKDSDFYIENGGLCFKGKGYDYNAVKKHRYAWFLARINGKTPDKIERLSHLFAAAIRCRKLGDRKVRIYYATTKGLDAGDIFYVYDGRRQYAGIFVDSCRNVTVKNVKQRFNYSLALVIQNTENVAVDGVDFSPEKSSGMKFASCADFIQICMCKGNFSVTNSYFDGAGDDLLNVHGMHLKIKKVNGNKIIVRYMHPQSYGYNAFHEGDELAFINRRTLAEKGRTVIKSSRLVDKYHIELELENAETASVGDAVEDLTMCPHLYFANNNSTRIITRGLLITTRGGAVVENNRFKSTSMSGILLSDDAKSWYESGPSKNVIIRNNVFDYCGGTPVLIKPENLAHSEYIHENILIEGNDFRSYEGVCVYAKSSKDIVLSGNKYKNDKHIEAVNCAGVRDEA